MATTNGYQAITTKHCSPTNHRGSRVRASCERNATTIPWDHALNTGENHAAAAQALIDQNGWDWPDFRWVGSALPKGGYAFVAVNLKGS